MVLVTGGTGFLGSYLICDLLLEGFQVRALKRNTSSLAEFNMITDCRLGSEKSRLLSALQWVEGDITDPFSLEEAMKGIKHVYHTAAIVSFQPGDKKQLIKVNVEGTANIVNACLSEKVEKLCHVSSTAAVGKSEGNAIITEEAEWNDSADNSNYAVSKYLAEMEVWRGIEEGLNAVVVNPGIIVGAGDWNSGSAELFKQGYKGLFAVTKGVTGYVDVKDVSTAMIMLMKSEISGERFLLISENHNFYEFFKMISEKFGKKPTMFIASRWQSEIAWRLSAFKTLFGKKAFITRETARSSQNSDRFSSSKFIKATGFKFNTIKEAINDSCETFKSVYDLS
ncbi:MAG: NAD-dependent epimerase/dehydratase family protein [Bacteroidia bacterium]|nr:NAD-dependent epimerase/dehydratase family protein [Bacteroidia bacterium]